MSQENKVWACETCLGVKANGEYVQEQKRIAGPPVRWIPCQCQPGSISNPQEGLPHSTRHYEVPLPEHSCSNCQPRHSLEIVPLEKPPFRVRKYNVTEQTIEICIYPIWVLDYEHNRGVVVEGSRSVYSERLLSERFRVASGSMENGPLAVVGRVSRYGDGDYSLEISLCSDPGEVLGELQSIGDGFRAFLLGIFRLRDLVPETPDILQEKPEFPRMIRGKNDRRNT